MAIVAATPMSELSAVNKFLSMEELSDGIHSFEFMGTGDPVMGLGLGGMDSSSFRLLSFKIEEKTFIPQCSTDVAYDKDYTGTESVSDWEIFEAVTQNGTATIGKKNSSTTDNRWQFSVSHTANEEQAETMAVVYATMATEPGYDYVLSFEGVDIHRNNTLQNEQRPMAGDTNFNYICLVGNSLMDMVMSQQFLSQSFLGSAVNGHTVQFTAQGSSVVIALMCQYRNVDVYGDSHATLELSGIHLTGYEGSTVTRVADGAGYRYGFNGQERETEIGNSTTSAEYWLYDGRLGVRKERDQIEIVGVSPYVTFSDNPILYSDPDGLYSRVGAKIRNFFWGGSGIAKNEKTGEWGVKYGTIGQNDEITLHFQTKGSRVKNWSEIKQDYLDAVDDQIKENQNERTLNKLGVVTRDEQGNDLTISAGQARKNFLNNNITLATGFNSAPQLVLSKAASIETTLHGSERIAGAAATRGGVLSIEEINATKSLGTSFTQADGATVYLREITPGKFNTVVEGADGLITTFKNFPLKAMIKIARKYGWICKL